MKHLLPGSQVNSYTFIVTEDKHQQRLDQYLHELIPAYSRSYFQKIIQDRNVSINNLVVLKAGHRVKAGDHVACTISRIDFSRSAAAIDPTLLHGLDVGLISPEPDFLIINKPAGLVVHKPAHASRQVTLVDWLVASYPHLQSIGDAERPGIVHRLDMQTSGLIIIPRTVNAHAAFTQMFKDRQIKKTYLALVEGHPPREAQIDYRIMRHPTERTKMAHSKSQGRDAITDFEVIEYLKKDAALVKAFPKTGRTHQIRVHCLAWGHPIIGDAVYGSRSKIIARHALHSAELNFEYKGKLYHFTAPMPEDMAHALEVLRS
ncbi:MAG: RluA family pseudouridine synthase [Candidatus Babeliaceae bacterium]|nr:RluA family pseudouridine synthase [Candidatus Babeliaceae bacterium]